MSESTQQSVVPENGHMVVYCDAGANNYHGGVGWGFHGYFWQPQTSKKGAGHPVFVPTGTAYVRRSEMKPDNPEIEVLAYFDALATLPRDETNNVGELTAAIETVKFAIEHGVKSVQAYTDSRYVCDGIEKWVPTWIRNNWIKSDRTEVKNAGLWKQFVALKSQFEQLGGSVVFRWVRGHNGDLGNEIADLYASLAVLYSRRNIEMRQILVKPALQYWKYESDRHPFFGSPCMYFNTNPDYIKPGVYNIGGHGKQETLLGTATADGSYAVVMLDEPDPILELIRARSTLAAQEVGHDAIMFTKLSEIFQPARHKLLAQYGSDVLFRGNPGRQDLYHVSERTKPLVEALDSSSLAWRAIEAIELLYGIFERFEARDSSLQITEITDVLYEDVVVKKAKKDIEVKKLRDEFDSTLNIFTVQAAAEYKDQTLTVPIGLVLGLDILNRNALKKLEDKNPKIHVVTWKDGQLVVRYVTIIETDGAKGIWSGSYTNTRLLKPEEIAAAA